MWYRDAFAGPFFVVKINSPESHLVDKCSCHIDIHHVHVAQHRRVWLVDRIKQVTSVFAIDVCSYAIMSNHIHIVLKVNSTKEWNATQVLMTWCSLYSLPVICDRYLKGQIETEAELRRVKEKIIWNDFSRKPRRGEPQG
jgi:hypothetical protein